MTIEEVKAHAQKFSQTYRKNAGVWRDNFASMGEKTVLRRLLSKWAPKSLELQKAMIFDQSVVNGDSRHIDIESATTSYVDNIDEQKVVEVTEFEEVNEETVDTQTGEVTTTQEPKDNLEF
jgi:recombination protein RecT